MKNEILILLIIINTLANISILSTIILYKKSVKKNIEEKTTK